MCVCVCVRERERERVSVHVCVFTNPSVQAGRDTRSIFKRSLTFEFRIFLLPDWLPYQG